VHRVKILRAAGLIAVAQLIGLPLGILVQVLTARAYGVSAEMDAFNIALLLPSALTTVLVANASVLLIPLVNRYITEKPEQERAELLGSVFKGLGLLLMVCIGLLWGLSGPVLRLLSGGFDAATLALTQNLFYFLLPATVFMVGAGVLGILLQARHRFAAASFSPMLYKIAAIAFLFFLTSRIGIMALLWAQICAAAGAVLWLWPVFRRHESIAWSAPLKHPETKALLAAVFGPLLVFRALDQMNQMVPMSVATHFGEGSVAALNYAWKLVGVPLGLMMTSLSTAIFPAYARRIAEEKRDELAGLLALGVKMVLLFSLPAMVGLVFVGRDLVRLLFERGAFDASATEHVYRLVVFYASGILGLGLNSVFGYFFWAKRKHWFLVSVAAAGMATNFLGLWLLHAKIGVASVPFGMASGYLLQSLVMLAVLKREALLPEWLSLFRTVGRIAAAAAGMGLLLWLTPEEWRHHLGQRGFLAFQVGVGALAFMVMGFALKIVEWRHVGLLLSRAES
jgi:putative peptidoglycan lipid II flippase